MSYCHKSKTSDLYLYASAYGGYHCCMCLLAGEPNELGVHPSTPLNTLREVWQHLCDHTKAGHKIPGRAIRMVQEEIDKMGWDYENPYDGEFI